MQSRPTTEQILADLAREVRENLMPAIDDPALRVNLEMMEQLLAACAVRSAHEIAWMQRECEEIEALAEKALERLEAPAVTAALATCRDQRSDSLHLDDRVENYHLAGEVFGAVIEAVADADDAELTEDVAALIRSRRDTEGDLRPGFYFPGRS